VPAKSSTERRVRALQTALDAFEQENPELVEALQLLGVRIEDYQAGLNGVTGPAIRVTTSTSPAVAPVTTESDTPVSASSFAS
jgi:hypothetical protein